MTTSPTLMKILGLTGNVLKSFFILIMIALALSVFGLLDINTKAKDEVRLRDPRVIAIKAAEEKIKRNIKKIDTLENGLNIYSFQYKSEPTTYVGFLAHDIAEHEKYKHLVIKMSEGVYAIHYEKLGFHPITLQTWQQAGIKAFKTTTDIANNKKQIPRSETKRAAKKLP